MPIRRAGAAAAAAAAAATATAAPPSQEKAPPVTAEKEPEASSEDSPPTDEAPAASSAAPAESAESTEPAEPADPAEPTGNGVTTESPAKQKEEEEEEGEEKKEQSDKCKDCAAGQCATHCYVLLLRLKDGYKYEKTKVRKVKRTIPAWASVTARKKLPVSNFAGTLHKMDDILIEALEQSSNNKTGVSYKAVLNFIVKKYPELELERRKFLIRKSIKKNLEKGTIKQLKGKGFSGSFAIGKKPPSSKKGGPKTEALGDALPLIITRLCEPKEASYLLIKKYLEQHFPSLRIGSKPDVLKTALMKAVEKGQLEQITGKGAQGTFQLKRTGNKVLLHGSALEDAIAVAITAMNQPKTCSITTLRRYLLDSNIGNYRSENQMVAYLRRTLTKCKVMGWMEQISGHGFTGTYQLSFPYYPSPTILDPERFKHLLKNHPKSQSSTPKRKRVAESSDDEEEEEEDEEDEEEEDESEDEAPARKRKPQKRPPPKARQPPASKKPRGTSQAKGRGHPKPNKSASKKGAPSAAPTTKKEAQKKKTPAKVTPVKKGSPAKKPKTPAVKKMTKRGSTRSTQSSPKEAEDTKESPKTTPKRGSKPETATEKGPAVKKTAGKSGSIKEEPEEVSPKQVPVKKGAKSNKQTSRKAKRGRK